MRNCTIPLCTNLLIHTVKTNIDVIWDFKTLQWPVAMLGRVASNQKRNKLSPLYRIKVKRRSWKFKQKTGKNIFAYQSHTRILYLSPCKETESKQMFSTSRIFVPKQLSQSFIGWLERTNVRKKTIVIARSVRIVLWPFLTQNIFFWKYVYAASSLNRKKRSTEWVIIVAMVDISNVSLMGYFIIIHQSAVCFAINATAYILD